MDEGMELNHVAILLLFIGRGISPGIPVTRTGSDVSSLRSSLGFIGEVFHQTFP